MTPTAYVAWTGTNGKLNVQPLLPAAQPTTIDQISNQGPALAIFNGSIYLAWTGTNNKLNVISSSDGLTWKNKVTLNQTSANAPALVAASNSLCLVWTGTDKRLNLIFSSDGQNWVSQMTLNRTSDLAPASAVGGPFQVQAVAWVDATYRQLSSLVGMGIPAGPRAIVNAGNAVSERGPGVAFFKSYLRIAWRLSDSNNSLLLASSSDGVEWTASTPVGQSSNNGPALAASSSELYLAWTDLNTKINVISSSDTINWGNQITLNQLSNVAPAIAVGTF